MLARMLGKRLALLLLLYPSLGRAQSADSANIPASLSRAQLVDCMDAHGSCPLAKREDAEAELELRLHTLSDGQIVSCFENWRVCGVGEVWTLADELRSRKRTSEIVTKYGLSPKWEVRNGIEHLAYRDRSTVNSRYMRTVFVRRLDDGENLYWPAMYLAKSCSKDALRYLDPGVRSKSIADGFSVSSSQFSETVKIFGRCHYRPTIPYLVTIGLHAASLNMVDASATSLEKFYPNKQNFASLSEIQQYYCARANADGFKLKCTDD